MDISAVILTYNSSRYIERCLRDFVSACEHAGKQYEIFVIDNGSRDGSPDIVESIKAALNANIHLIRFDHNTGTTFSRNQGLANATGRHIVVLDSDAYVNSEALSQLSAYLDNHAGCGMAVPKLTYPDGRFQLSTDSFPTFVRKLQRFFFLKKMEKDPAENAGVTCVDYAISAFWMFPRSVMDKVGLLDERIFYSP